MALINHVIRDVNAKIVYFGPGFSGKETSVTHIYRKLNPEFRSTLKSMAVQGNRMLFFDFRPTEKGVDGYSVRFHLYTVADEVLKPSTWKMVLKGADGVVFVADSDPARQQENLDRLDELQKLLAADGPGIDQVPLVMQYNRRDLPTAVPLEEMQQHLNRSNVPVYPTVASTGNGVLSPLSILIKMVLAKIRESLADAAESPPHPLEPIEGGPPVIESEPPALLVTDAALAGNPVEETAPPPVPPCAPPTPVMEARGGEFLPDGSLCIPIQLTCGGITQEYRLVVSLKLETPA